MNKKLIEEAIECGKYLTKNEVRLLENGLNSADLLNILLIRCKLLAYSIYNELGNNNLDCRQKFEVHALWIIEHFPGIDGFSELFIAIDHRISSETYDSARKKWIIHLAETPNNLAIMRNAADFFSSSDPNTALGLYRKLQELNPDDPLWVVNQARLYDTMSVGTFQYSLTLSGEIKVKQLQESREFAEQAFNYMTKAVDLVNLKKDKLPYLCDLSLYAMCTSRFALAYQLADEMIIMLNQYYPDFYTQRALFVSHLLAGLSECSRNFQSAKSHFALACNAIETRDFENAIDSSRATSMLKMLLLTGHLENVVSTIRKNKELAIDNPILEWIIDKTSE